MIKTSKRMKRYTVLSKELGSKKIMTQIFSTLLEARRVGLNKFRLGTFKKLFNINGVVLNLM